MGLHQDGVALLSTLVLSDSVLVDGDCRPVRGILHSSTGRVYVLGEHVLKPMLNDCSCVPGTVPR